MVYNAHMAVASIAAYTPKKMGALALWFTLIVFGF
jgi:hypothetical protein